MYTFLQDNQKMENLSGASHVDPHAAPSPPAHTHLQRRRQLPERLLQGIETLSGLPMRDVEVHYNSPKPAAIQALAYTQGTQIHIAPGQERHLAHEAWHVVQQKLGRVRPTITVRGVAVNDESRLEQEAEDMGRKAARFQIPDRLTAVHAPMKAGRNAAQRRRSVTAVTTKFMGQGQYKIEIGANGQQTGSVLVHNQDSDAIHLTDLGVAESHRKQGLGQQLIQSAARTGQQLGKTKMQLAAQDNGTGRLLAWYKKLGFTQVGHNQLGYPLMEASLHPRQENPVQRVSTGEAAATAVPAENQPTTTKQSHRVTQRAIDERQLIADAKQQNPKFSKLRSSLNPVIGATRRYRKQPGAENLAAISTAINQVPADKQQEYQLALANLQGNIQTTLDHWKDADIDTILNHALTLEIRERQATRDNPQIRAKIRQRPPGEAVAIMGALLTGSLQYAQPLNGTDIFYNLFVRDHRDTELPDNATLNCWEFVLYSAYLTNALSADDIFDYYKAENGMGTEKSYAVLGWHEALPSYIPGENEPHVGDILFVRERAHLEQAKVRFPNGKPPGHVIMYIGNDEALTHDSGPGNQAKRVRVSQLWPTDAYNLQYTTPRWL